MRPTSAMSIVPPASVALLVVVSMLVVEGGLAVAGGKSIRGWDRSMNYSDWHSREYYYQNEKTELFVSPDALTLSFKFSKQISGKELSSAEQDVKDHAGRLFAELQTSVQKAKPSLLLRNFVINEEQTAYSEKLGEYLKVQLWATIEGVVDIPLQPSQTFWDRVAIYKQAYEAKYKVDQHFKANAKKGTLKVAISSPVAVYRSPEKYRLELMKRWTERARAFAGTAQAQPAPLYLVQCTPPKMVVQRMISLQEVGLSLDMDCRLDSTKR